MPYQMHTKPLLHQAAEWERTQSLPLWAHFWDMGTGKTKMAIDLAGALWEAKEITSVLVVAPNSVHDQWITEEIPKHLPPHILERVRAMTYRTSKAITQWQRRAYEALLKHDGFSWLAVSYDGFMTKTGKTGVWDFIKDRKCLYILDESHWVKTPSAKRTISIVASGRYCRWKRALSGTPVANSPFDVYTQVKFLQEDYWKRNARIDSSLAFRHRFGVFRTIRPQHGRAVDVVTGYQRLDELHDLIAPISSRVLKEDVLDLPPKTYVRRYFDLTGEQRRVYEQLQDEFEAELDSGQMVTSSLVVTRLVRFQQLFSGFLKADDGSIYRFDPNPRMQVLEETLEGAGNRQVIVWAAFNDTIDEIMRRLGSRAVRFDGKVQEHERTRAKKGFVAGDHQYFVAKTSVGGTGLNLVNCWDMIYYDNTPNLVHRLQSEDRSHRLGQTHPVTCTDILSRDTHESKVLGALLRKFNVAAQVTGDQVREWLRESR